MSKPDIVIVGGGLSGLSAARSLAAGGASVQILCGGAGVGGRVRTDAHDAPTGRFLLDRGFQVYLTAYEETGRLIDTDALGFRAFYPGSLVRFEGSFHRVADPFRKPLDAVKLFASPVASLPDKARLGLLDQRIKRSSVDAIWARPERTTLAMLREAGFGEAAIERFFRPFFGGVFFDRELETSSRMFEFTYKHFATGDTALPAQGMGAIPQHIADRLTADFPRVEIKTDCAVARIDPKTAELTLGTGEAVPALRVLIATDGHAQAALLGQKPTVPFNQTATVYYDADPETIAALGGESILVLDGDGTGPVNHLAVPNLTQPGYAPEGRALVACSIVDPEVLTALDDESLDAAIRKQMVGWFGDGANQWNRLRVYRIRHALPRRVPGEHGIDMGAFSTRVAACTTGRVHVTGDHLTHGSIEGAVVAGRRAAEMMLAGSGSP
ncbi:MAG: FAD-dependent oxidoreductase [Planctomycetota bacterium]